VRLEVFGSMTREIAARDRWRRRCFRSCLPTRRAVSGGSSISRRDASRAPEEMANAALFLASDEAWYVNWSTFLVDGGITAA